MSIRHAILGVLSWRPSSGYELKKVFEGSSSMYWSGNNNQIYRTLIQLHEDGLVASDEVHREGSPTKKVYTITGEGLVELREWVRSTPEAPDLRKTFLIQLAWADFLNDTELDGLLSRYGDEVQAQLAMEEERCRRGVDHPNRSPREGLLWRAISGNLVSSFKAELEWVRETRKALSETLAEKEGHWMNHIVIENERGRIIEVIEPERPVEREGDALDLLALCGQEDAGLLILHGAALSDAFYDLRTGLAGAVLQKFVNYQMRVAVVTTDERTQKGRFGEMVREANKGRHLRFFGDRDAAVEWLLG